MTESEGGVQVQYLGGKSRLGRRIVEAMQVPDGARFIDVFAGGLNVVSRVENARERVANDGCVPLINMYRAWLTGWRPSPIDESRYADLKSKQDSKDPHTAFAGFGLSYAGKWFGGFARSRRCMRDFAATAVRSLDKKLSNCEGVIFTAVDFADVNVEKSDVVYCDPPYRGTTSYGYFHDFDYGLFLECCSSWANTGATVFVSEYQGQSGWDQVAEWPAHKGQLGNNRIERLFRVA